MLSRRDKEEMLEDGTSGVRKVAFRKAEEILGFTPARCLDDYIGFLTDIQKIFSPFVPSTKKTVTKFNKL